MARFRRTDDDQGAMDSLLDTMTNVVGILVIVLVVTQLGVGDAVQRIGEKLEVEPAELEQKKRELADLRARQDRLKQEFQDLPPIKSEDVTDQLKRLQVDLDQKTIALKNLRQKNRQSADEMARQKKRAGRGVQETIAAGEGSAKLADRGGFAASAYGRDTRACGPPSP